MIPCNPTNAGYMLDHRLRRWPNMYPALGQRLVYVEKTIQLFL